jgi:hypothetical protein
MIYFTIWDFLAFHTLGFMPFLTLDWIVPFHTLGLMIPFHTTSWSWSYGS